MQRNLIKNLGLIINIALLVAWTAFIWHNSMEPASVSSSKSVNVTEIINKVLEPTNHQVSEHFVRKSAHFTEFAIDGFLLSILSIIIITNKKPIRKADIIFFLIGFILAYIDERIQYYTPGRASQFLDVLLDTVGVIFGFLAFRLFFCITARSHRPS